MIFSRKKKKALVSISKELELNDSFTDDLAWKFAMEQILIDNNLCTYSEFANMCLRKHAMIDQWTQEGKDKRRLAAGEKNNE